MPRLTLYSQNQCPPCDIIKMFLKEHKISYIEKNINEDHVAKDELVNKYKSFSTPTIVFENQVLAGFDIERLKTLLNLK